MIRLSHRRLRFTAKRFSSFNPMPQAGPDLVAMNLACGIGINKQFFRRKERKQQRNLFRTSAFLRLRSLHGVRRCAGRRPPANLRHPFRMNRRKHRRPRCPSVFSGRDCSGRDLRRTVSTSTSPTSEMAVGSGRGYESLVSEFSRRPLRFLWLAHSFFGWPSLAGLQESRSKSDLTSDVFRLSRQLYVRSFPVAIL